jgi:SAM-dependent methyltransferase
MSLPTQVGHSAAFPALATARLGTGWYVCDQGGRRTPLRADLERWCGDADAVDLALLARAEGPVIDVGCGPGRLVVELARQGHSALGVDVSSAAVRLTTAAGGAVVRRSVFDRLPGEGRWGAALLADGNVGIGGDPVALLRRCRALVRPDGRVLVELEAPGAGCTTVRTWLERGSEVTPWFDWAHVGVDAVAGPAAAAGLSVQDTWGAGGRWFASLTS